MKRSALIFLILGFSVSMTAYAEDASTTAVPTTTETPAAAAVTPADAPTPPAIVVPPVPEAQTPVAEVTTSAPVITPSPAPMDASANMDNLEFISGEVGELDEAGKTLTIKLYGETETAATDKTLKVTVDSTTDITDGEQDRDFKSLAVGTEVDVEYDPTTNKATYIFVY